MRTYKDEDRELKRARRPRRRATKITDECGGSYWVDYIPGIDCDLHEEPLDVVDYLENDPARYSSFDEYKDDHDLYLEGLECQ